MISLLAILTFVAAFLLVFGVNLLLTDLQMAHRQSVRKRLDEEWRTQNRQRAQRDLSNLSADLSEQLDTSRPDESTEPATASTLNLDRPDTLWQKVAIFVQQSGKQIKPEQLLIWSLLAAIVVAIPTLYYRLFMTALLLAPLAASIPWFCILRARRTRLEKLRSQLPDVFDLMSRVLRAGNTISQALESVADEMPRPAAEEFSYTYEQQNLGLSPEAAMRDLARRTGLLELKVFVLAVMVQRQTGGNMAELLNKLSTIIRDRYRVRGMIRALTAEGRLQAWILLALPPLLLAAITLINRPYATILYQYPKLLLVMAALMTAGGIWMRRIVNFDF
jgi:tight adherence protein B